LDYFPQLLGDKMSLEPRLSALSLLRDHPASATLLTRYFSTKEWDYYQKLLTKEDSLLTSSMGRLMDGIAAIMGVCPINSYEGQTAMEFEALARSCKVKINDYYSLPIKYNRIDWRIMVEEMITEIDSQEDKAYMAKKLYHSLVHLVEQVSDIFDINELAFSGGVFQNSLLNEMIDSHFKENKKTYFHKQLSPNDECISFGQLAMYKINHYPYAQETNNQYQSVSITL
jgi:hydrogenase maturation protein HypF